MVKVPSYALGLGTFWPGISTPEITSVPPTLAFRKAALTVTLTTLPASEIAVMPEVWLGGTFGRVKVVGFPRPVADKLGAAGVNELMMSDSPKNKLPALATKTRPLLGNIA